MLGGHGIMITIFEGRSTTDGFLNNPFAAVCGDIENASKTHETAASETTRILGVVPGMHLRSTSRFGKEPQLTCPTAGTSSRSQSYSRFQQTSRFRLAPYRCRRNRPLTQSP